MRRETTPPPFSAWEGQRFGCPAPAHIVTFRVSDHEIAANPWAAEHAAVGWLTRRGFLVGSMQGDAPRAAFLGADYVSKWRGLSPEERRHADAILFAGQRGHRVAVVEVYAAGVAADAE